MANTETLEQIAELLPQKQREQFLAMILQFKTVPDDDEYLQILNAIGFMTLLWKQVPEEVKAVLEGANPVTETCQSIAKQLSKAVAETIPSYEDLKLISKRFEDHDIALKRHLNTGRVHPQNGASAPLVFFAGAIGVILGFFVHDSIHTLFLQ